MWEFTGRKRVALAEATPPQACAEKGEAVFLGQMRNSGEWEVKAFVRVRGGEPRSGGRGAGSAVK